MENVMIKQKFACSVCRKRDVCPYQQERTETLKTTALKFSEFLDSMPIWISITFRENNLSKEHFSLRCENFAKDNSITKKCVECKYAKSCQSGYEYDKNKYVCTNPEYERLGKFTKKTTAPLECFEQK